MKINLVAECSVCSRSNIAIYYVYIRIINVGMSSKNWWVWKEVQLLFRLKTINAEKLRVSSKGCTLMSESVSKIKVYTVD